MEFQMEDAIEIMSRTPETLKAILGSGRPVEAVFADTEFAYLDRGLR